MMEKLNFTYQTKNLVNDKTYIGVHSTNDIDDGYLGSGDLMIAAIKKYGRENFKMEPLSFFDTREEAEAEEILLVDKEWIEDKNNYNISLGGGGSPMNGRKHSEETKAKMVIAHTGLTISAETRAKISAAQIGKVISDEQKAIMSINAKKRTLTLHECTHCGETFKFMVFMRYHGNQCSSKESSNNRPLGGKVSHLKGKT